MAPDLIWKRGPVGALGRARWLFRWCLNGRVYLSESEAGAVLIWTETQGADVHSGSVYESISKATREEMRKPLVPRDV